MALRTASALVAFCVAMSAGIAGAAGDKERGKAVFESQCAVCHWMTAGLAFNYTNYDGTYDDGGGFDKNIFGPLLYASFLPFQGAFTNVVLGYARQENHNTRLASASSETTPPVTVEGIRRRITARINTPPASSPATTDRSAS
jgi:hypothetical protein